MLQIHDLHTTVDETPILQGVSLTLEPGQMHVLMGPNGSGKSTLALALMGHPKYSVTAGSVTLNGHDMLEMEPHERAQHGLFLAFQYPTEVEGVTLMNFLWTSYKHLYNVDGTEAVKHFRKTLYEHLDFLGIDHSFVHRQLNKDLSGGEKKRCEILQMLTLDPQVVVLDETDSGLDIDSIQLVAKAIRKMRDAGKAVLVITHYRRIADHLSPDQVHIMTDGRIAMSGTHALLDRVESEGYRWLQTEHGTELITTSDAENEVTPHD